MSTQSPANVTAVPSHEDRSHAVLAPSAAKMQMTCLASLLPPSVVVPRDSSYAKEGTLAHEYFERVYQEGWHVLDEIKDEEMRGHVEAFVKLINRLADRIGQENIFRILIEERVRLNDNTWGTVDCAILYKTPKGGQRIYVLDKKYGVMPVYAEENYQLLVYLLCLQETFNWYVEQATLAIYQPRAFEIENPEDALDQWVVNAMGIDAFAVERRVFEKQALPILKSPAKHKDTPEIVGSHCFWCPRQLDCKEYRNQTSVKLILELDQEQPIGELLAEIAVLEDTPPETNPKTGKVSRDAAKKKKEAVEKMVFTVVNSLTNEQLSQLIEREALIRNFLSKAYQRAAHLASLGVLPGWSVVPGRSTRKWIENEDAVAFALTNYGIDDPYKKKLIGITEVEKIIGEDKLEHLTTKTTPKDKLVKNEATSGLNQLSDLLDELDMGSVE